MTATVYLLLFISPLLLVAAINRIELIPWTRSEGQHWAERARILWPVRRCLGLTYIYVPVLAAIGSTFVEPTDTHGLIPRWITALVGTACAGWITVRSIYSEVTFKSWLHQMAIEGMLKLAFWSILIVGTVTMPDHWGVRTWLTLAGAVLAQLTWPCLGLFALRMAGILKPAGERLARIVEISSQKCGIKVKRAWEAKSISANALALPQIGSLIFFDRLLEALDDEELESICSHEIGHLGEPKPVIIGRLLGSMMLTPLLLMRPAISTLGPSGILVTVLIIMIWSRLANALTQRMELRADKIASDHQTGEGVYARALEKIHKINYLPAIWGNKNTTHPDLYDRMVAAGFSPKFPPPRPPKKLTPIGWLFAVGGPALIILLIQNLIS